MASPAKNSRVPSALANRRAIDVVESPFDQIAGRRQVLQALLVLNADRLAAEFIGDAQGSDIHPALLKHLVFGEVVFFAVTEMKIHALGFKPIVNRPGIAVADLGHRVVKGAWLRRSLNTPVGFRSESGMIALNIPMQPSSKTPMMALSLRNRWRNRTPSFFAPPAISLSSADGHGSYRARPSLFSSTV